MKGTFFSADFVIDKNDNLRLIEINTDTGIVSQQKNILDWTDFINVLSYNNITELIVIYKHAPQAPIIESLSDAISKDAPFITNYVTTLVPEDVIFPPTPTDSPNTFILRMAYDELAILDSEYAKGTLSLLELFVDNDDEESVIGFCHGTYNTISTELSNPANVPDIICKTTIELQQPHNFYKIGNPDNKMDNERILDFIEENENIDNILEEYHFSPQGSEENNKVYSQRTFQIVYGPNLDLCYVSEYDIPAVFEIPETIEYDETILSNKLERKHYYEFATNHIKNYRHGFLDNIKIVSTYDGSVFIKDVTVGSSFKSFYIAGSPDTDIETEIRDWKYFGDKLPEGSYETTSQLKFKFSIETYANDMTTLTFENGSSLVVGGETRILAYDTINKFISYQRVLELTTDFSVLNNKFMELKISNIETTIFQEPQEVFSLNLEPVDNFLLDIDGILGFSMSIFYIVHNCCFPAGTKIKIDDVTEKNIEDIAVGDYILSFNELTMKNELKEVTELIRPINNDLVTYHFENNLTLTSTFDHPIYVDNLELASYSPELTTSRYNIEKNIRKIKVGDSVYLSDNKTTIIKKIEELSPEFIQTYIFRVQDNHNFYANNVLVHNK